MDKIDETKTEFVKKFKELLACGENLESGEIGKLLNSESVDWFNEFYIPSEKLCNKISEYNEWCVAHEVDPQQDRHEQGQLMEQIAALAFDSLSGYETIKSFQSYNSQLDLVVTGSSLGWNLLLVCFGLKVQYKIIIVEAKNTNESVSDAQLSRLCSILSYKYPERAGLGVFFSRSGASGFDGRRSLAYARATQAIYHAATGKYVVVLDHDDIQGLTEIGALPRLLKSKMDEIENGTGQQIIFDDDWRELASLPAHLAEVLETNQV